MKKVDTGRIFKNFHTLRRQADSNPAEFNKVVQQILPLAFSRDQYTINDISRLLDQG